MDVSARCWFRAAAQKNNETPPVGDGKMLDVALSRQELVAELSCIEGFLRSGLAAEDRVVVGASGGLDSDVLARLAVRNVGCDRVKLFFVIQQGMDERHAQNARQLASDIGTELVELDLADIPFQFMRVLAAADPSGQFMADGLIDTSRAKCSLRTVVLSTYVDRGYVVLGSSNRTEFETGFFLPLGDGVAHLKPLVHLYKAQVRQLAQVVGTRQEVLDQPASSGFWVGAEDLWDMSFWILNEAPIGRQRTFTEQETREVEEIHRTLSTAALDNALYGFSLGQPDDDIAFATGLPIRTVQRLRKVTEGARVLKRRELSVRLPAWARSDS
jgi:NAD+ synthase